MTTPSDPSQSAPDPTPRRARRRLLLIAAGAAVVLTAAAGVYAYQHANPGLEDRDPSGAQACTMLAEWQRGDIKETKIVVAAALGDQAAKSTTDSIRAAAGDNIMDGPDLALLRSKSGVATLRVANLERLHAACEAAGVDMPPYVEPGN